MSESIKKDEFDKIAPLLREDLREFWEEQFEDDNQVSSNQEGPSVNITNISNRFKSFQVAHSLVIVEEKLGFTIPEGKARELIKEGGYASFDEMESDLFPKLQKLYIAGGYPIPEKKEETLSK